MIRALALAGPTACGKSAFAPTLAAAFGGEIISVDSGAVYREMDIGTAKPPAELRARLPHHLVDVCAPDEPFNVGMFCRLATAAAKEVCARGDVPIFVGGAMMYFNALVRGLHDFPEITAEIRDTVREMMRQNGAPAMHQKLAALDSRAAEKILITDSQRIARAMEIAMQTRRSPSDFIAGATPPPQLNLTFVFLSPANRTPLRDSIAARLAQMWTNGLVDETEQVMRKYKLPPQSPPLRMAGYRQAAAFLRGETSESEMREHALFATRQLAKRQMTWIRNWKTPATIIDPFTPNSEKQILSAFHKFSD